MCGVESIALTYLKKGYEIFDQNGDFKKFKGYYNKKEIQKVDFSVGRHLQQVELNKDCLNAHCRTCQYSWVEPTEKDKNG